jgi:hypothetical protein
VYLRERKAKAVKLLISYDLCATDIIKELEYPDWKMLYEWYVQYPERTKDRNRMGIKSKEVFP